MCICGCLKRETEKKRGGGKEGGSEGGRKEERRKRVTEREHMCLSAPVTSCGN